jgi:hypothetical protein
MTGASLSVFYSISAQVIPVFILAILVDASRFLRSADWEPPPPDLSTRRALRSSRLTLIAIIVGGSGEIVSLATLLIIDTGRNYTNLESASGVTFILTVHLVLILATILPHFAYHVSIIARSPGGRRLARRTSWSIVAFLLLTSATLLIFIVPQNKVACSSDEPCGMWTGVLTYLAIVLGALSFLLAGSLFVATRLGYPLFAEEGKFEQPAPGDDD